MRLRFAFLVVLALTACNRTSPTVNEAGGEKLWEQFSGEKALAHVERLVSFGARPPGSEALERTRVYIADELKKAGWKVERQTFSQTTPRGPVTFVNLLATFGDASSPSFLLCSHYDTKFFDTELFVGANDGGSSNGVLLEMARVLASRPKLAAQVQLVFFDGEEAYVNYTPTDGFFGSRYFARQLVAENKVKQFRGGILFDMVGDRDLRITLPPDSPPQLTLDIFAAAKALEVREHFTYAQGDIQDDHTALNAIGIPVIDLIDFDYPPWHTAEDTLDKLSAQSLRIVGSVATYYLVETGLK